MIGFKHIRKTGAVTTATAVVALAASVAFAEGIQSNISDVQPEDTTAVDAIQTIAMAQRLATYAMNTNDPLLLIAAARIANQFEVGDAEIAPRDTDEEIASDSPAMQTAGEMLAMARELAGDRQDLILLIEDVEAESARGSLYGAGSYEGYIAGYDNLYYDEAFEGGVPAIVELTGHNPSDLDLWIYDEFGNEICSSTSYSSFESCQWTPRWTGGFTIRVENEGHAQGSYFTLWTN